MDIKIILPALLLCFGVFALGDILGVYTKAKVSSVFIALLIFLFGFMFKIIPADIVQNSTLNIIAVWASGYIVFHMGTMINLKQLVAEYKTVVITLISMVVAAVAMLILLPFIGNNFAIGSIPVINGGIIATNVIGTKAAEIGANDVAAFVAILYAIQKFVGAPIASYFGLKQARVALEDYRKNKPATKQKEAKKNEKTMFYQKYSKYYTDFVCIALAALFVYASFLLSDLVKPLVEIHYTIFALIIGATVGYLGMVPPKVLEKGKSSGLLSVAVFASIIPSLAKVSLNDLVKFSGYLVLVFAAFLVLTYVVFYILPTWKIIGSKNIAMGIAMGQLLGFPATYLISQEIAKAVTDDPEEQEYIMELVGARYVVAGFASVTTFSVITAGILVQFIR